MTTVVGSGIMGERLAGGNVALALLGNTLPTGGSSGGADPRARADLRRAFQSGGVAGDRVCGTDHPWREFIPYAAAQIVGGCIGTLCRARHVRTAVFELAVKARTGPAQWFAEFVATFGLIVTILAVSRFKSEAIPVAVGLYITAAYWFTASTSFANPGGHDRPRADDSFSGIAPIDVAHVPSHSLPAPGRVSSSCDGFSPQSHITRSLAASERA